MKILLQESITQNLNGLGITNLFCSRNIVSWEKSQEIFIEKSVN